MKQISIKKRNRYIRNGVLLLLAVALTVGGVLLYRNRDAILSPYVVDSFEVYNSETTDADENRFGTAQLVVGGNRNTVPENFTGTLRYQGYFIRQDASIVALLSFGNTVVEAEEGEVYGRLTVLRLSDEGITFETEEETFTLTTEEPVREITAPAEEEEAAE